jgi:hypothetical protein
MNRIAGFLLAAAIAYAADDPWAKVQALKSGSEIRVYKKTSSQPLIAKFDEANDERIVVVVKNEQVAIQKEDIERVDARVAGKSTNTVRKIIPETTVKSTDPDYTPRGGAGASVPGTTYSSGVNLNTGKGDFETVYRRTASAPKNQQ